jgi:hypothetical protein
MELFNLFSSLKTMDFNQVFLAVKLNYVFSLIAFYIIAESLSPIFRMGEGLKDCCHKLKYLMVICTTSIFTYKMIYFSVFETVLSEVDFFMCSMVLLTCFFVVWPRTVWRLKHLGIIRKK